MIEQKTKLDAARKSNLASANTNESTAGSLSPGQSLVNSQEEEEIEPETFQLQLRHTDTEAGGRMEASGVQAHSLIHNMTVRRTNTGHEVSYS